MADDQKITRRKMLAVMGMAGTAAAGGLLANGALSGGNTVLADVYGPGSSGSCTSADWYNVQEYGLSGDGTTDDSAALLALVALAPVSGATFYFPSGTYRLGANATTPVHVRLLFDQGAVLSPDAGVSIAVNGAVEAGLYRIFAGLGRITGHMKVAYAYPQWWGAMADGANDDSGPINKAMEAMAEAGGGTVFLPAGIYLLATVQGANNSFIIPRSHVRLVGVGDNSVLKPADHMNEGRPWGWNVIFPPQATVAYRVDHATYCDFKVDCNGVNNLEVSTKSHKNAAIGASFGSNITVERITVVNNAGRQCFSFGRNQKPHTITDLTIRNCLVDTVGKAVPGNTLQNDHSVVYAQADRCVLSGNRFSNPVQDRSSTAFEVHSSNCIVTNNITNRFATAVNIVAIVTDQTESIYSDNIFKGCDRGILVWCYSGMVMDNIRIVNNVIEQAISSFPVIDLSSKANTPVKTITITGNTLISTEEASSNRGSGITVGRAERVDIRQNRFHRLAGRAIELGIMDDDKTTLLIEDNEIVDCGRTLNGSYKNAITLNQLTKLTMLRIVGNLIQNSASGEMGIGINGNAPLGYAEIVRNTILNTTGQFIWADGAAIDSLLVDHAGAASPDNAVRAAIGSRWLDRTTGDRWVKAVDDNLKTGWREEAYPS